MPSTRVSAVAKLPFDVPLLLIVVCLLVFGLLMVYSSSWDASILINKPTTYVFTRQLLFVLAGIAIFLFASFLTITGTANFLLHDGRGGFTAHRSPAARRSSLQSTRALFGGSIQPSELSKLGIIIYLSFCYRISRKI